MLTSSWGQKKGGKEPAMNSPTDLVVLTGNVPNGLIIPFRFELLHAAA